MTMILKHKKANYDTAENTNLNSRVDNGYGWCFRKSN